MTEAETYVGQIVVACEDGIRDQVWDSGGDPHTIDGMSVDEASRTVRVYFTDRSCVVIGFNVAEG